MALLGNDRCVSDRALGNLDRVVASKRLGTRCTQEQAAASAERTVGSVRFYQFGGRIRSVQICLSLVVWRGYVQVCGVWLRRMTFRGESATRQARCTVLVSLSSQLAVVSCHGSRYESLVGI